VFGLSVVAYAEMMVDSSAEATHNLMNEASVRPLCLPALSCGEIG
jgi:hypothetical protein